MRNVFDQYQLNENRLTHALATALDSDIILRNSFLKKFVPNELLPVTRHFCVTEQNYPGQSYLSEKNAEKNGVPDIWFFNDESKWCAVVENKITSRLEAHQVERHIATARRRGFEIVVPITISIEPAVDPLPAGTLQLYWKDIYLWLDSIAGRHSWAAMTATYFETLEALMVDKKQLAKGTLTTFGGIQFANPKDYSYLEAKRVLRLALNELRNDKDLLRTTGMDPRLPGRPSITGVNDDEIWDYLQINEASASGSHRLHLHLTLGISRKYVEAMVTIPNKLGRGVRPRLAKLEYHEFLDMLGKIKRNLRRILRSQPHAIPALRVIQRRYPSQKGTPFVDSIMTTDIRTAMKNSKLVKTQPQWIKAAYDAFANKNSNLQMQIGVIFPISECPMIQNRDALTLISKSWQSCGPLFETAYPDRQRE